MSPGPRTLLDVLPFLVPHRELLLRVGEICDLDVRGTEELATLDPDFARKISDGLAIAVEESGEPDLLYTELGVLVPALEWATGPVHMDGMSTRLRNVVMRLRATWPMLASTTIDQVRIWPQLGKKSLVEFLSWLFLFAVSDPVAHRMPLALPRPKASRELTDPHVGRALADIAAWSTQELGEGSLLAALRAPDDGLRPTRVAEAFDYIAQLDTESIAAATEDYDLSEALHALEVEVGNRAWKIYEARHLSDGPRPTLDQLGAQYNVTRERIRQIETQAKKAIELATATLGSSVLARAAARLALTLGDFATIDELDGALKSLDPSGSARLPERSDRRQLLLLLAGPYHETNGWLVRRRADSVLESTVHEALDNGPISLDEAFAVMTSAGVPEAYCGSWLERIPRIRAIHGHVVRWDGTLADKAAIVLSVANEPMSLQAIFDAIGENKSIRSLGNNLPSDERFMRRDRDHWGLREWGGEEYTTIVEEIEEELERQGGSASIEHLVTTLTTAFGVAANSVRTYALQHPRFGRTQDGMICVRSQGPSSSRARNSVSSLAETRCCFKLDEGWALRLVVTFDTLRGSGTSMPGALANFLGLEPGGELEFNSVFGPLRMTWPSLQPSLGSQRAFALGLALQEDDLLFLEFVGDEVRGRGIHHAALEGLSGESRLAREMAAPPDAVPLDWICRALELEREDPDVRSAVRRRLIVRREHGLAQLVSRTELSDTDEEVFDILASLGE